MNLGETYSDRVDVYDIDENLGNAGTVTVTVVRPDGTTASPTVTPNGTGHYDFDYVTTMVGRHTWYARATGGVLGSLIRDYEPDAFHVDDASTGAPLVGLAEVKEFLGKDPDRHDDDEELRRFIRAASAAVEGETRLWHRATVVERLAPARTLLLASQPVSSVTSVVQGATTYAASTYRLTPQGYLTGAYGQTEPWSYGSGAADVVVTYVAGETIVPQAVREAVMLTVQDAWETQRGPALPLASGGDFAPVVPRPTWTLPPEAEGKLRPWLRPPGVA